VRVLETAGPPTFYLPPADVDREALAPVEGTTFCEWKGTARYFALAGDSGGGAVAWCYPDPKPEFEGLRDWLAFYPGAVACYVGGERVRAQTGGFYGGWVTDEIVGPFKGEAGTGDW
ncbi:MAG TPA: DUF427 domain-containing protein, partial [Gammaproteobacteria bacterium]|nr:DUF427 domain-containing protein [Gammaproteobacteria bacterium]